RRRGPAEAVESVALCGCGRRAVRGTGVPGADRRRGITAEPRGSAADAGHSDCRAAGRPGSRRSGHASPVADTGAPGWAHREPRTRRADAASVDVRARPATGSGGTTWAGEPVACTLHQ